MKKIFCASSLLLLVGCSSKTALSPSDPYEDINRKTYKFNKAIDATLFRPVAKVYKAILPPQVQNSVRNSFNNLQMIPTVANDLLQTKFLKAYKDTWRFFINSTLGVAGLFDVAEKWGLPYESNDFGITLAKWGDINSPYFVIPLFGPSTFRDTVGISYDFNVMSAYAYVSRQQSYSLMALNSLQIRADLIGTDKLVDDAIDEYTLVRDAYLQSRNYEINGESHINSSSLDGSLYIDGTDDLNSQSLYIEEDDDEITAPLIKETVKKST